jgi:hypothetical protein
MERLMPFIPNTNAQVPTGGNEPLLLSNGQSISDTSGFSVRTDANKANPHFVPDEQPYSQRKPGIIEQNLPPVLQPYAGRIADIATGANDSLAGALAIPANSVANIFQGFAGKQFTNVDEMKTSIQDALRAIPGMGASKEQAFNKWYADLGEQAGRQALLTMALIAGGPAMAAIGESLPGTSTTGAVLKNIGNTMVQHPGMVAAADAGAVAGGQIAPLADPYTKALGLNTNPEILGLLGTLAGGPIGASIGTLARIRPVGMVKNMLAGGTKEGFGGLPRFGGTLVKSALPGAKPLLGASFNGQDVADAIKGVQLEVMNGMKSRIDHVTKGGTVDPAVAAQRVREVVKDGYKRAGQIADNVYWAKVDQKRPVATIDPKNAAKEVALSAQDPTVRSRDIPGDFIRDIMKWPKNVSMERMRQVASAIRKEAATLGQQGNTAFPSDERRANLTKLANSIDDSIAKAYPDDRALAEAKAYTTWMHDTFSRGPVGQFGEVRRVPGATTDAPSSLQGAMRDSRFGSQMANMGETTGLGPEVQGRTEDYLRSMVADAYRTGGPRYGMDPLKEELYKTTAAKEYMNSPDFKRFAKAFPQLDSVFQRQTTQLQNATNKAAEIARSHFFAKAATDPENAVENLFNSGTKVKDTKLIMENIGSDHKAVDAIQYAMIRKLGNSVNWDPENMLARLGAKDLSEAFTTIMGEHEFRRMYRIIDTGAKLQAGESGNLIGMSPIKTTGRILGSLFTGAAGGKSIQVHSIGTKIGGNIMEKVFHTVPPEFFIQKAMVDPNWERFLMSKLPDNMEGFRTTTRLVGMMASGVEATHNKLMEDQGNGKQ